MVVAEVELAKKGRGKVEGQSNRAKETSQKGRVARIESELHDTLSLKG